MLYIMLFCANRCFLEKMNVSLYKLSLLLSWTKLLIQILCPYIELKNFSYSSGELNSNSLYLSFL